MAGRSQIVYIALFAFIFIPSSEKTVQQMKGTFYTVHDTTLGDSSVRVSINCNHSFLIKELRENDFSRYSKLRHLNIYDCPLKDRIHDAAFQNASIETLGFVNCELTKIPEAIFSLRKTLIRLTLLDENVVKNIPNTAFEGFPWLSSITLSKINKVPKALVNIKYSLEKLDLSNNRMMIKKQDFTHLHNLKRLYLPNVGVKSLPVGILDDVADTLVTLFFPTNHFTNITWLISFIQSSKSMRYIGMGNTVQQVHVLKGFAQVDCDKYLYIYFDAVSIKTLANVYKKLDPYA